MWIWLTLLNSNMGRANVTCIINIRNDWKSIMKIIIVSKILTIQFHTIVVWLKYMHGLSIRAFILLLKFNTMWLYHKLLWKSLQKSLTPLFYQVHLWINVYFNISIFLHQTNNIQSAFIRVTYNYPAVD